MAGAAAGEEHEKLNHIFIQLQVMQAVQEPFQEWLCKAVAAFPWMEPMPMELGAPCAATAALGAAWSSRANAGTQGLVSSYPLSPSSPQPGDPSVSPIWMG